MKKFNEILGESILSDDNELSNRKVVKPKSKYELRREIENAVRLAKNEKQPYKEIIDLNYIDVSNVDNMTALFAYCDETLEYDILNYNYDVSEWNVSNCKYLQHLFYGLVNFNCDLSKWKFNKDVNSMANMFKDCEHFEGKGLEKWDVHMVTDFKSMFEGCKMFNADLSKWDVSRCDNFLSMFKGCVKLSEDDIDNMIKDWKPVKLIHNNMANR